ncbi:transglycosylase SLT domain-containing protein [Tranquillimonas rosea]
MMMIDRCKFFLRCIRAAALVALFFALAPFGATASPDRCDRAAQVAAAERDVPLDVMRAITRTETGRQRGGTLEPWPWTVNLEGDGHWFDTLDAALAFAHRHHSAGARSFDVGCFQVNFRWHGSAFESLAEMFDPAANARYAASFLARLKAELGTWEAAAGAYHSRTRRYADRYLRRFSAIRADLEPPAAGPRFAVRAADRPNLFPLLRPGGVTRRGSLVPLDQTARAPLFARRD